MEKNKDEKVNNLRAAPKPYIPVEAAPNVAPKRVTATSKPVKEISKDATTKEKPPAGKVEKEKKTPAKNTKAKEEKTDKPAPKPITAAPAPKPIAPAAAPKPIQPVAAPKPVMPAPAPRPITPVNAPKPIQPAAAPKPVMPAPAPRPIQPIVQDSPKPVVPAPAPKPITPVTAPQPIAAAPAPRPVPPIPVPTPVTTPPTPKVEPIPAPPPPRPEPIKVPEPKPTTIVQPKVAPPQPKPLPTPKPLPAPKAKATQKKTPAKRISAARPTLSAREKFAVFIDIDNTNASVTNLMEIFSVLKSRGEILFAKIYGYSDDKVNEFEEFIISERVETIGKMRYKIDDKSTIDTRLITDAIRITAQHEFDTVFIWAGVGDMVPLFSALKENNVNTASVDIDDFDTQNRFVDQRLKLFSEYTSVGNGIKRRSSPQTAWTPMPAQPDQVEDQIEEATTATAPKAANLPDIFEGYVPPALPRRDGAPELGSRETELTTMFDNKNFQVDEDADIEDELFDPLNANAMLTAVFMADHYDKVAGEVNYLGDLGAIESAESPQPVTAPTPITPEPIASPTSIQPVTIGSIEVPTPIDAPPAPAPRPITPEPTTAPAPKPEPVHDGVELSTDDLLGFGTLTEVPRIRAEVKSPDAYDAGESERYDPSQDKPADSGEDAEDEYQSSISEFNQPSEFK
ncbi:MAG: NYN domain-containing protein [Firmicutes bacterium]|nr:NYN domain-containing protein [Bacillota bacterium]